ncbi:MAG TPA: hypothetical protein VF006_23680 [Longimicrobium sp.]
MSKLRLSMEDLSVESFQTTRPARQRGTVVGQQCTCPTYCTCPGQWTCGDVTCAAQATCVDETCADTCDNFTCLGTCGFSNCETRCGSTCRCQ